MAREMKDSGIAWIGMMPCDWKLYRMKRCISERTSGAWGNEASGDNGDVICLRIADFDYSKFRFKNTPEEELTVRNYDEETITQLSHKQFPANSNSNSEKQEEKRRVDIQAGTVFAESRLLKNWRKRHWMKRGWEQNQFSN